MNNNYLFYSIIRYMPSVIKEEVLNIGIVGFHPLLGKIKAYTINNFRSKKATLLGYKIDKELFEISLDSFLKEIEKNNIISDFNSFKEYKSGIFFINNIQTLKLLPEDMGCIDYRIEEILKMQYEKYVEKIILKAPQQDFITETELGIIIKNKFRPYIESNKLKKLKNKDMGFNHLLYEFKNGKNNVIGKLSLNISSIDEEYKNKISNAYMETMTLKNTPDYHKADFFIIYAEPKGQMIKVLDRIDYWLRRTIQKETKLIDPNDTNQIEKLLIAA